MRRSQPKSGAPAGSVTPAPEVANPLAPAQLKSLGLRIGLPLLGAWGIGAMVFGVSQSTVGQSFALGVPAALTAGAAGLVIWMGRQARKAQGVAGILRGVETAEQRKEALEKLGSQFKAGDPTAVFARAQLLLQEEPREALEVLETIDLGKVMANVADEARGQRAMIHLMLGEPAPARDLVDGIQLSRHQDARSRSMLTAVTAEAWARTGQAKRAVDVISLVKPEDQELEQLRPQIYRSQAFAFAYAGDVKKSRQALRKLSALDPRLLGGFLGKKGHPLLQKEARKLLEQSGAIPRQMQVQRRL